MNTPPRPLLRYHGGKWRLAHWIIEHFPRHQVYVEPFGGAASVLLKKPRAHAEIYNDLDSEIVNLFCVMRDNGELLREKIKNTPFAREEFNMSYAPSDDPIEQARRTLVRAFMGFSSASATGKKTGFRANSDQSGTTPARDWKNFPSHFETIIDRLRGVVIERREALAVIRGRLSSKHTLFYVDPPYVPSTRDKGVDYRYEMSEQQHRELATALRQVAGMVVLSGYRCELYDELYVDWQRRDKKAYADGGLARIESIWLSPNIPLLGLSQGLAI